ncbi:hypothetical protein D210916BOD24_11930 [Alteromonas sp. D210916BOD_24]|uniref:hypothetical protein n=1 Tax=Alteromonas sp. D210916BOD_24 TaxID=3157618 RepID=UPI00399CD25F
MTNEEFSQLSAFVHDARKPLNRISMQAELVKMALSGEVSADKAYAALDKIISSAKDCSHTLADLTSAMGENLTD